MSNKLTISVGIAAYYAEQNIKQLLSSLINQDLCDKYILDNIFVYYDKSGDNTLLEVSKINNQTIKILTNTDRVGFANALIYILKKSDSDLTVILNDDIKIVTNDFIRLIADEIDGKNIGLITGNPLPHKPISFAQKLANTSFEIWNEARYKIKNGHNKFTCDGKTLGFTKKFKELFLSTVSFGQDQKHLGNVDAYLYYFCLSNGLIYKHSRKSICYFDFPATLSEYLQWEIRNKANKLVIKDKFNDLIEREESKPFYFKLVYIKQIIRHPIYSLVLFSLSKYVQYKSKNMSKSFNSKWNTLLSTKKSL